MASVVLKLLVTVTTLCLLVAILAYHVSGVQLSMAENGFEDWRLVTRPQFVICVSDGRKGRKREGGGGIRG